MEIATQFGTKDRKREKEGEVDGLRSTCLFFFFFSYPTSLISDIHVFLVNR